MSLDGSNFFLPMLLGGLAPSKGKDNNQSAITQVLEGMKSSASKQSPVGSLMPTTMQNLMTQQFGGGGNA